MILCKLFLLASCICSIVILFTSRLDNVVMRTPKRRVINRSFIFLFEFISLSGTVLWLKGVLSSSVPSAKPPNQPPRPTRFLLPHPEKLPQVLSPVFRQPVDVQDGGVHVQSCSSGKFLSLSSSCSETWPIIFHRILTIGGWKTGQSIGGGGR